MYGESNMETYTTIYKIDGRGNLLSGSGNSNRVSEPTWGRGADGEGDGRKFHE